MLHGSNQSTVAQKKGAIEESRLLVPTSAISTRLSAVKVLLLLTLLAPSLEIVVASSSTSVMRGLKKRKERPSSSSSEPGNAYTATSRSRDNDATSSNSKETNKSSAKAKEAFVEIYQAHPSISQCKQGDFLTKFDGQSGLTFAKLSYVGSYVEWPNVSVPREGTYRLTVRYSSKVTDGESLSLLSDEEVDGWGLPCKVVVNGKRVRQARSLYRDGRGGGILHLHNTDSFHNWKSESIQVLLREGENTIRISSLVVPTPNSQGGAHIDLIKVEFDGRSRDTLEPNKEDDEGRHQVTYMPGVMTKYENGLFLSQGLTSRIIATVGEPVVYANGELSPLPFHENPDGAATFAHPTIPGHYAYVSNSENHRVGQGGVGAFQFDADGNVLQYRMILTNTTWNCAGGESPWNTWLSAEEHPWGGQIYEVDPFGRPTFPADGDVSQQSPHQRTVLGGVTDGEMYEAVTVDNRNPDRPVFYYTVDDERGEVRRYRPHPNVMEHARHMGDYSRVLSSPGGIIDFLVLAHDEEVGPDERGHYNGGTFRWTEDIEEGKDSAFHYCPMNEGIEFDAWSDPPTLYFVTKERRSLFALDLDGMSYTNSSTRPGIRGSPDGMKLMHLDDKHPSSMLYFTEDGGKGHRGIYFLDRYGDHGEEGQYVTVLVGADHDRTETSGLAFSPDHTRMYFTLMEKPGHLIEVRREDGLRFCDEVLPVDEHLKRESGLFLLREESDAILEGIIDGENHQEEEEYI